MTYVVVNDASCLIDLRKGGLLPVLCRLPYSPIALSCPFRSGILNCSILCRKNGRSLMTGA